MTVVVSICTGLVVASPAFPVIGALAVGGFIGTVAIGAWWTLR